jgi:toxin ParE1/3/4
MHVAWQGKKGRHFVMFRVAPERVIEVLRLLHDSMDLSRHWPNDVTAIQ